MEAVSSNIACDREGRALKSLIDIFGSMLSLEDIASAFCKAGRDADMACELLSGMQTNPSVHSVHISNGGIRSEACSIPSDDNAFNKSSYTNGNCVEKALGSKRIPISVNTVGKECVWRAKVRSDAKLAGVVVRGTVENPSANPAHLSDDCTDDEVNPGKSSKSNGFTNEFSYMKENNDSKATELEKSPSYIIVGSVHGKDYVWGVRQRQDADPKGELLGAMQTISPADTALMCNDSIKDETNSGKSSDDNGIKNETNSGQSSNDNACSNSCYEHRNDDFKGSRLKNNPHYVVASSWSHGKDYVWRVRKGLDASPKGVVMRGIETSPSLDLAHGSNSRVKSEAPSQSSGGNGFSKSCHPDSISNCALSRMKRNPASVGTVSSIPSKNYVWRPRKGQHAYVTGGLGCQILTSPSTNMAYVSNGESQSETSSKSSDDNVYSQSCYGNGIGDSQTSRLKSNPLSSGTAVGVVGRDYVWRVRTKGTPNVTEPSNKEANKNLRSACSSLAASAERDGSSSLNKDFEDFLLVTLGKGFQLERSTIQEVLGNSGYDMKKSLETILDLAAVNLDRRNNFHKGINLNLNSKTLSSHDQGKKQKLSESGRGTLRSNGTWSRQSDERGDHQNKVSTSLFHVPERPDSTFSNFGSESPRTSEVAGTVVTDSMLDIAKEYNAKATSCDLIEARDEAEENSYQILRETVKEYRDKSKEYYKAAAEAFASGDHAGANILLEKGQFFYNKAREADEESAEKIFEISSRDGNMQDDISLDLRHHNAKEAIQLLKCHLRSLSGILSIKNLQIILGIGEQDAEKCKRAVIRLLEREVIDWVENEDSGSISIRLDQINPKCLSFTSKNKAI